MAGVANEFRNAGFPVFGPSKTAAEIEGSKVFMKEVLTSAGVPTAAHRVFSHADAAAQYVRDAKRLLVLHRLHRLASPALSLVWRSCRS